MKKLWNTSLVPIQWAKPHDATKMPQLLCVKLEDPKKFTSQALRRSRAVIHLALSHDPAQIIFGLDFLRCGPVSSLDFHHAVVTPCCPDLALPAQLASEVHHLLVTFGEVLGHERVLGRVRGQAGLPGRERRPELFTSAPDFVPFRVRYELNDQRTSAAGTVLGGLRLTDPMGSVDIARLQLNSEHSTQVDRHTRRLLVSRLSHAVEVETIATRILFDVVNGLSLSFDDFLLLTYLLLELLNLSVPRFEFFFEDVSQRLTDSTVTKAGHHGALQGFLGDRRFF